MFELITVNYNCFNHYLCRLFIKIFRFIENYFPLMCSYELSDYQVESLLHYGMLNLIYELNTISLIQFIAQYFFLSQKMKKEFDQPVNLESKLLSEKQIKTGKKQVHEFYCYKIGKIKNPYLVSKFDVSDAKSQSLLSNAEFYIKDASTWFQEKSIGLFFHKIFTTKELQKAIAEYTTDGLQHINEYVSKAKGKFKQFQSQYKVTEQDAYGCCLALSYYTGTQSERISRTCNIIIKLYVEVNQKLSILFNTKETSQQYQGIRCIGQWLFKALNCIQLHWGLVTRCVDLSPEELNLYKQGNIITWLQFSSSSYGNITSYFAKRNTRFIIYSLSGRCIQVYSNYSASQSEVLFKPFSHFMVYKREQKDAKQYIYMRQIFIGQSKKNVLWVDDNIFDKQWQNKKNMEKALVLEPLLNIIPKINTQCALAFLQSQLGRKRNKSQFRIITDMNRLNENPSHTDFYIFILYNIVKV